MRLAPLFGLALLAGCPSSPPADAGHDVGVDAPESDVPGDAGPCGMACTGTTPFCDTASGDCVECLAPTDCTAPERACVGGDCVACDDNADCTEVDASLCDTTAHTCGGCTADADCTHLTATPVCDETTSTCVACTADTEAARCGANACIVATGTCGTTPRGSLDVCDECEADSECAAGQRCVDYVFMGSSVGTFCFLEATGGCGDTSALLRPYSTRVDATSLGGVAATYCFPPATTTCAGVRDARSVACTTDDMCGLAGANDGFCPTTGTGAGLCSYRCGGAVDCRDPLSCGGAPGHCRP